METILLTVPLGIQTAQYEYRGTVDLPENDALAWLDEEIEDSHESRRSVSSAN